MTNDISLANPYNGELKISGFPNLNLQINKWAIPSVALSTVPVPARTGKIHELPGTTLIFEPFRISWLLSENLDDYFEILDWLYEASHPTKLQGKDQFNDLSFIIYNNNNVKIRSFHFIDAFPIALSELPYDLTTIKNQPIEMSTTFEFTSMVKDFDYNQ